MKNTNNKTQGLKNLALLSTFIFIFLLVLPLSSSALINNPNLPLVKTQGIPCDKITGSVSDLCTITSSNGTSNSTSDGNNYTTAIAFTGGTTKTLNLAREGMVNLTATFDDNEGDNNYPTSLAVTNDTTTTITIGRNGLSNLVTTFFVPIINTSYALVSSLTNYVLKTTLDTYFTNGTNVNHTNLTNILSNYPLNVSFNSSNFVINGNVSIKNISCSLITGGSDSDYCADATGAGGFDNSSFNRTQFIVNGNISINETWLETTDNQGSSSSSTTQYPIEIKRQLAPVATTSSINKVRTDMEFLVKSGTKYNMNCDLLYTSAVATTGMVINLTTNASTSNVNIMYDTWSSATASVGFSATTFNTYLNGTGSGATVIRPNKVIADFTATSDGYVNLTFVSEVETSNVQLERGSICELHNVTALQPTPQNNASGRIPAIKRQDTDILSNVITTFNNTNMSFDLNASKTYHLECDILYTSAVATTGMTINLTTTASTSNVVIMYDTWSSATASVGFSATTFNTALTGTGSGATIIRPNKIIADFSTSSTGILNLTTRSEVATSLMTLESGSMCKLWDVT